MKAAVDFQKGLIKYLRDPEAAAEYLNTVLAGGDPKVLFIALRNVAQAQGNMTKLAKQCKISRGNLYHITSKRGNPTFDSVMKMVKCLGLSLSFTFNKGKHSKIARV